MKILSIKTFFVIASGISVFVCSCAKEGPLKSDWTRTEQPVYRDIITDENYEVASDAHVFFDENGNLKMIYSGDFNGVQSIGLASGSSWQNWEKDKMIITTTGPSGLDVSKETPFYRLANNGKHQIYYIGYQAEETYLAQIYMAESDSLNGVYTTIDEPLVKRGEIAGKNVYCMTSPSIVEHNDTLFMAFIGWNAAPNEVTEVWVLGATSTDDGYTWSNFKEVNCRIGMEGHMTKGIDGQFYAVRTGDYKKNEGIFISTANHPFGEWNEERKPILLKANNALEKDEIIAPQIIFDPLTGAKKLYYTGADHSKGWWIMLATEP